MKNNKPKWNISVIIVVILAISSIFLLGFKLTKNKTPNEFYIVYLNGEKIGTVVSKQAFTDFINKQEEKLKEKYGVDEIYTPNGVEIKKVVTYNNKTNTNEEIYNRLVTSENFTIKGVVVEVTKEIIDEETEDEEEQIKTETVKINLLNKEMFDKSITEIIKAFIDDNEYQAFMTSTQEQIKDTGEIIEDIYIQEKITYKEDFIPTNEKIFTDTDELTMYLMYGTTEKQSSYIVKAGDTIESIAENNKLNVQEFLIANPDFSSANNLLYESQEVSVGLIDPIISVVVDKYSVQEEVQDYDTEVKYDDQLVIGYSYVEREGEEGLAKVTRIYKYINGQVVDVAFRGSVEIKPSVSKILVKGDKYVPNVADLSYWAWPTSRPYSITSGYGWRWGAFHDALDIYVGHGSPIYAANNGTVYLAGSGCVAGNLSCNGRQGNFVVINHNIGGYYTIYMHLKDVYVKQGQTVERGQKIGTMGNTGNVYPVPNAYQPYNGTHLHFSVRRWSAYGSSINPYNLY